MAYQAYGADDYAGDSAPGEPTYAYLGLDGQNKKVYRGSDGNLYWAPNLTGMEPYSGAGGGVVPGGPAPEVPGGGSDGGYTSPGAPIIVPPTGPTSPTAPTYTPAPATPAAPHGPAAPAGPTTPTAPTTPAAPTRPPFNSEEFNVDIGEAPVFAPPTWQTGPAYNAPTWEAPPAFAYQDFARPDAQRMMEDPGYQFRQQQGQQALMNNRAARGLLGTGGTLKDFLDYNQNFASQEYGNVWDRAVAEYSTNRGNALGSYDTNYKTQYVDPYDARVKNTIDAYDKNYKSQYLDPYEASYKSAADQYGQKFDAWKLQADKKQHEADEKRRYAWLLASG